MNINEFGNAIRIDLGEDVRANTNIMEFTGPAPTFTKFSIGSLDGLSVGGNDVETPIGTFLGDQYVQYTTKEGDFDTPGVWQVRVISTYPGGGRRVITDLIGTFRVDL